MGHTIKADLTRVKNTFFKSDFTGFTPRYCDVKDLWKANDPTGFKKEKKRGSKTLAGMMNKQGWLVSKDPLIRKGNWRTMEALPKAFYEYAVVDVLSTMLLYKHYAVDQDGNDTTEKVVRKYPTVVTAARASITTNMEHEIDDTIIDDEDDTIMQVLSNKTASDPKKRVRLVRVVSCEGCLAPPCI